MFVKAFLDRVPHTVSSYIRLIRQYQCCRYRIHCHAGCLIMLTDCTDDHCDVFIRCFQIPQYLKCHDRGTMCMIHTVYTISHVMHIARYPGKLDRMLVIP